MSESLRRTIIAILPWRLQEALRRARNFAKYYGRRRFCPVCERSSRRFLPYGLMSRKDAQCFWCGSVERHRLVWLYLSKKTNLFNGSSKKMLHVAPEKCLEARFKQHLGNNYISADLDNPQAMVKMDITDIKFKDHYFDVIYCSHVLEHVNNDRKAMKEFYRVLKEGGWAILLVPITAEKTFEDPTIVAPEDRLKAFGQEDHVRRYGPDYIDRLHQAGFNVEVTKVEDLVDKKDAIRMGLTPASGEIYYCTKPNI